MMRWEALLLLLISRGGVDAGRLFFSDWLEWKVLFLFSGIGGYDIFQRYAFLAFLVGSFF